MVDLDAFGDRGCPLSFLVEVDLLLSPDLGVFIRASDIWLR
jgi:hypothetical protein